MNKLGSNLLISMSLLFVLLGFVVMAIWGNSLAGLVVGILLLDIGVFGAQIPNQVRIFSIDPQAQSRINAVYMLFYYLGASFGSAVGVKVMAELDWSGLTTMGVTLALSALAFHQFKNRKA